MKLEDFKENKLISIIRGVSSKDVERIFQILAEEGIKLIEVTLNTNNALEIIKNMRAVYDGHLFIGAGTVLNPHMAQSAIDAGAQFLLTPTVNVETIKVAKGIPCITGALTPTEILTAYEHGSTLVKIFPAGTMGVSYLKDLQGPLPQIPTVPTGGINTTNAKSYLEAGATALGIGSSLVKSKPDYNEDDFQQLRSNTKQLLKGVGLR